MPHAPWLIRVGFRPAISFSGTGSLAGSPFNLSTPYTGVLNTHSSPNRCHHLIGRSTTQAHSLSGKHGSGETLRFL